MVDLIVSNSKTNAGSNWTNESRWLNCGVQEREILSLLELSADVLVEKTVKQKFENSYSSISYVLEIHTTDHSYISENVWIKTSIQAYANINLYHKKKIVMSLIKTKKQQNNSIQIYTTRKNDLQFSLLFKK